MHDFAAAGPPPFIEGWSAMTDSPESMVQYYARRAGEYESVYQKPERQPDLRLLKGALSRAFCGRDVLEIACGTGYWTRCVARSARSIVAVDLSEEMLERARQKDYGSCEGSLLESDAYGLKRVQGGYGAGFHAFWWSHVPLQRLQSFLRVFHSELRPDAKVLMADNRWVRGSSTTVSRADSEGNTYQIRRLADGSEHEVLKNFPTPEDIRAELRPWTEEPAIRLLQYCWIAEYKVRNVDRTEARPL